MEFIHPLLTDNTWYIFGVINSKSKKVYNISICYWIDIIFYI
jgi:hypothetical protein